MKKALIIVDMQNDFVDGVLGSKEAVSIKDNVVNKVKEALTDKDTDIFFTTDTHDADTYDASEEGKNLPVPHCISGTRGWKIIDELQHVIDNAPANKIKVLIKNTFGSDKLLKTLQFSPYDEMTLIGLCTDICVISNAIVAKTAVPNTHIIVDASCCAGVTPESHDTALSAMSAVHVEVVNKGKEPWRQKRRKIK